MSGFYYFIGGAKTTREHTAVVRQIISMTGARKPRLAYIDAAYRNEHNHTHKFKERFYTAFPQGSFKTYDLFYEHPLPADIRKGIGSADVIFMAGGDTSLLSRILKKHRLQDDFMEAVGRGAAIGGLCAGGMVLYEQYVRKNSPRTIFNGLGLVPSTGAMSKKGIANDVLCEKSLRDSVAKGNIASAFSVGLSNALIYREGAFLSLTSPESSKDVMRLGHAGNIPAYEWN